MDFDAARQIMVDSQIRPNDVCDPAIVGAFLRTPRERFVPSNLQSVAYSEREIETSPGRWMWTARDTAKLIKMADAGPASRVLVIGAGAGYEVALFSRLAADVTALDEPSGALSGLLGRLEGLIQAPVRTAEGPLSAGWAPEAPYDVIYVCGMVQSVPEAWTQQLAEGGRLAVVVEEADALGRGRVYTRAGTAVSARSGFDACPPRFAAFDRPRAFVF